MYAGLMRDGWRMQDIDTMDILYFLRVRAYEARKAQRMETAPGPSRKRYIDEVWPD